MKQIILDNTSFGHEETPCLTGLAIRWGLFGLLMWWLWPSGHSGAGHAMLWIAGLVIALALVKREFDT